MRSKYPLWKMANEFVHESAHFPEPDAKLNQLHRPMIANMSYFEADGLKTAVMARILMTLMTKEPKQQAVFGSHQIPEQHGGGPFFAAARACVQPAVVLPSSTLRHKEVIIKGLTQLSKTPETICQAFVCFFAEGVLPNIMVRNRGGANVGTADMRDAVLEMNKDITRIYEDIQHLYRHHPEWKGVKATDFHLTPRCTSGSNHKGTKSDWLEIHGGNPINYRLKYPQVLISCTNVHAIKRMTETIKGRGLGADMGMSLIEWASGWLNRGDPEDANPHVQFMWDVDDIPKNPQSSIALLFDEDDANRSSTGGEKTDKLLFTCFPGLKHMIDAMCDRTKELRLEWGDSDDDDDGADNAEESADRDEEKFYKQLASASVRSRVARVFAYTATPSTILHDLAPKASQIDSTIIELNPGRNYVGYVTSSSQKKWPWLEKHIRVKELPNRLHPETFSLTALYPKMMRKYVDPSFRDGDDMPSPFKTATNGTISLPKQSVDDEMILMDPRTPGGRMTQTAGWLRDKVKRAKTKSSERMDKFWRFDGVNLVRVLQDIHDKKEEYPESYRNLLYMTNFSRQEKDQVRVVDLVLSLGGEHKELVEDLICVEFTYKHLRFSWCAGGGVDKDTLKASVEWLKDGSHRNDPVGFSFGERAVLSDAEDGEIQILETDVPNINWAYSVLWEYKTRMERKDPTFFLKVMVVAGEIGARGVRYKAAKTHQFCLTDMFHAFDLSSTMQICSHGAGTLQSIGRLCSMVRDLSKCPTITLWMPEDCWKLTKLWMEALDCLPDLLSKKLELEHRTQTHLSMEDLLKHVTQDPATASAFPDLQRLLTAPTGHNKKGDPLYARADHMLAPGKQRAEKLASDPGCLQAQPIELDLDKEERREEMAKNLVDQVAEGGSDDDDGSSSQESDEGPCPPVAKGERSVPQPKAKRRPSTKLSKSISPKSEKDQHGIKCELRSPMGRRRSSMDATEKSIEEYLYHDKENWKTAAIILRRIVYECVHGGRDTNDHVYYEEDLQKLLDGHAKLEKDLIRDELRLIRKTESTGDASAHNNPNWWRSLRLGKTKGPHFSIFQPAHAQSGTEDQEDLIVSRRVVAFAEKYRDYIKVQPPRCTFNDLHIYCENLGINIILPKRGRQSERGERGEEGDSSGEGGSGSGQQRSGAAKRLRLD